MCDFSTENHCLPACLPARRWTRWIYHLQHTCLLYSWLCWHLIVIVATAMRLLFNWMWLSEYFCCCCHSFIHSCCFYSLIAAVAMRSFFTSVLHAPHKTSAEYRKLYVCCVARGRQTPHMNALQRPTKHTLPPPAYIEAMQFHRHQTLNLIYIYTLDDPHTDRRTRRTHSSHQTIFRAITTAT